MTLLSNAVMAIQAGLEDFEANTPARLHSAVRGLHAGVLLLLKAKLLELSPPASDEVLLRQRIKPVRHADGSVTFSGSGKKTVDAQEIQERLTSLGVEADWKRLKRLTDERNNIEHYYSQLPPAAVRGLVADVFVIIRDFTSGALGMDPRVLLGDAAWDTLLANDEVATAERAACVSQMESFDWGSSALADAVSVLTCPACGSELLAPTPPVGSLDEVSLACRACQHEEPAEKFVPRALREGLSGDRYEAAKGGDPNPLEDCPECGLEAYVREEDQCAFCGQGRSYEECRRCGANLDVEEQDLGGLCSWCSHQEAKDD